MACRTLSRSGSARRPVFLDEHLTSLSLGEGESRSRRGLSEESLEGLRQFGKDISLPDPGVHEVEKPDGLESVPLDELVDSGAKRSVNSEEDRTMLEEPGASPSLCAGDKLAAAREDLVACGHRQAGQSRRRAQAG